MVVLDGECFGVVLESCLSVEMLCLSTRSSNKGILVVYIPVFVSSPLLMKSSHHKVGGQVTGHIRLRRLKELGCIQTDAKLKG